MNKKILALFLIIPATVSAGGFDKFVKALGEAAQQTQERPSESQVTLIEGQTPDICISNICVGDDLAQLDSRIDVAAVVPVRAPQEVYKEAYVACEKERPAKLEEAKKVRQLYQDSAKAARTQNERAKASIQAGFIQRAVDAHSSNQSCIDLAKKMADSYVAPIASTQASIRKFIGSWGKGDTAALARQVITAHPEAEILNENDAFGTVGGILFLNSKTAVGSYKDALPLASACQPTAIKGTIDTGKASFIAVSDPTSNSFKIAVIRTTFDKVTREQSKNVAEKYREKFGKYAEQHSNFQLVTSIQQLNPLTEETGISVTAVHPVLSSENLAGYITQELPSPRTKGQFSGIRQASLCRGDMENCADGKFDDAFPKAFLQLPQCARLARKMSDVEIR